MHIHVPIVLACLLLFLGRSAAAAAAPSGPADALAAAAQANNAFAAALYAQAAKAGQNTFFSPASISTALAMTAQGANGPTEAEMLRVLGFKEGQASPHEVYAALLQRLAEIGSGEKLPRGVEKASAVQFSVANRLWGQQGFHFLPTFLDASRKQYGAALEPVDFAGNTEAARKTINAWVEQQTHDKIKELIKPRVIDSDTRLVLTNAIYFKGAWADPFRKEATKDEAFTLAGGDKVTVPTMHRTGKYRYGEAEGLQVVEMPYIGHQMSMVVLLPRDAAGLGALDKKLADPAFLPQALNGMESRTVVLSLPKFTTRGEFELADTLQKMGMTLAFDPAKADFSKMTTQERLWISRVVHQAFVDVNEEGTEAAAATAVVMTRAGAPMQTKPPVEFKADHPFAFLLRDTRTGAVLFMGHIVNPK